MTIALLLSGRVFPLLIVFGSLVLIGFASIREGESLITNKEQNVELNQINNNTSNRLSSKCQGMADCFNGTITEVIDGDTLDVNNVRIRLALIDAPERNETGYSEALHFVESSCKVGTQAKVDEDDRQKGGSFGRMIALVYCGYKSISINEAILGSGLATIYPEFCNISEFATSSWAIKYCSEKELHSGQSTLLSLKENDELKQEDIQTINVTNNVQNCDPSYPDLCIPSPPPDLDCNDISQKNFTVRGSDPHRFDLDGNGRGCEG